MPDISVLMGVCNSGPFLAQAVASVQAQSFTDWELILVDNGSTDGALDALLATGNDGRLRVFRHPEPLTPGGALVWACREARGRYLAVLDADDLAHPRRLEIQRAYLDLQPDLVLLGCAVEVIDAEGRRLGLEPWAGLHEEIVGLTAYVHVLRHSGVMFRRELLAAVQYRPLTGSGADFDFFARAAETGRIAALPAVLCSYRVHGGNHSRLAALSAVSGGLVRMLTRRRRGGLPEDIGRWAERFAPGAQGGDAIRAHLHCARIFREEGQDDLAALHAWLAWRAGGRARAAARYLQAVLRGLCRSRGVFPALVRAWFKEPAHQLLHQGGAPERHQF